jgi:hypothetical protein
VALRLYAKERKMSTTSGKENHKNANNTQGTNGLKNKKFMGGNQSLQGKVFEISSKDSIHQFAKTLKATADYVG